MEENINIFALVLDELNKNDMWFTTKADPTAEEASSYYKLDEYGEPTEATVKKIEKEVTSLIGDGAVYIEDAVELWVNDALVACRIDYKDNLVTQFEDKPVVDNIEAYENPVQLGESKKIKVESKVFDVLNKLNASNFVELKDEVEKLYSDGIVTDDQYDRFMYIIEKQEEQCYDYIDRRAKVTNTDDRDIDYIESDYVVSTLQMLIAEVDDLKENKEVKTEDVDEEKTKVIFRKDKEDGDIIAVFPEDKQDNGMVGCYVHLGQHTTMSVDYYNENTVSATPEEYRDLKAELENIVGYNLEVVTKLNEAKTKKTEGAGAGYEIRGTVSSAKVNNYEVIGNTTNQYNEKIYELKCDIDVKLEDVQFESYYYGGKIDFPIDGKVTYLIVSENSNNDIDEVLTNSDIENALDGAKIKEMLGGGWIHETFTGDFSGEFDGDVYGDYYALDFEMTLTQEPVIDFIDKKVDGVMDEVTYCVYDKDNDPIDDFLDKDEAIEFAKKNGYVEVVEKYHDYQLIDADGSIDDNSYEDGDIVWEREYTKQYKFDSEVEESKKVVEAKELNFKVNDIVEDKTGVGKIMEIDPEHPEGLIYGVQFSNVDLPDDKDDIGLWWCKEGDISLVTDKAKIDKYNKWFNTEYNKTESKKAERKKKQIEEFKNRKVNFNKRTKEENYQRRLDEVNDKSKNLISDLFSSNDFDSDSPAGQIVMRTSEMFNALSDKGYDVEVTFDNGESTSAIQLGQQGGKVMITITNTDQPLRAFTSGNFEINDQNIKILQDIQSQIEVL